MKGTGLSVMRNWATEMRVTWRYLKWKQELLRRPPCASAAQGQHWLSFTERQRNWAVVYVKFTEMFVTR